ncbi:hypothetical protein HPB50_010279 [Hyalomma asiaticum]|uniref:Uncharacterized protein n=1 Tax=Hyalomma asiaticum TaxID=266040 RepID=A0ACB7SUJ1_HYAAI|nr:hypothetical protein HPB50_010279 [Hyalomma asiaticum]
MVASSPVRHEGSDSPQPLEVHAYQPPWKALAEYAMHPNEVDPTTPHFQHLVNQARAATGTGNPKPEPEALPARLDRNQCLRSLLPYRASGTERGPEVDDEISAVHVVVPVSFVCSPRATERGRAHEWEHMHGYDTGDPGCMGVLPLGAGGHYLCPDDGLGAPPSNLSSHHSSHLPGTPSELSSPTSE